MTSKAFEMLDFIKPSWDHIARSPLRPRLPPSFFSLKARKAWLHLRPEFSYGDDRDKIQRQNSIKAQRKLASDEQWALRAKKAKERKERAEHRRLEKGNMYKANEAQPTTTQTPKGSPGKPVVITLQPVTLPPAKPMPAPAPAPKPKLAPPALNGWSALRLDTSAQTINGKTSTRKIHVAPSPIRPNGRSNRPKRGMPARSPVALSNYYVKPAETIGKPTPARRPSVASAPKPATKPVPQQVPRAPPVTRSASVPKPAPKPTTVQPSASVRVAPSRAQTAPNQSRKKA